MHIFVAKVRFQRGLGGSSVGFPLNQGILVTGLLLTQSRAQGRKRRISWPWDVWNGNNYLRRQTVPIQEGQEQLGCSLCSPAHSGGGFGVSSGLRLAFPVARRAGILVSEEAWVPLLCVPCAPGPWPCPLLLSAGGTCQSPASQPWSGPPAPPLQPPLDIKPFLPFPSRHGGRAVNLFPHS